MSEERMPMIARELLTAAQERAWVEVKTGPRGWVGGPFNALIRTPELMSLVQQVGQHLRFAPEATLSADVREVAVLTVSRWWTQHLEWSLHLKMAAEAGVSADVRRAIEEGRRPPQVDGKPWHLVWDFLEELRRTHGVSDQTFADTKEALGEPGVVELLVLAGYFTTLSMILNVNRTRGGQEGLVPLPLN